MTCEINPYEEDIEWLLTRWVDASESTQEAFAEKVAFKFSNGLPETLARLETLAEFRKYGVFSTIDRG